MRAMQNHAPWSGLTADRMITPPTSVPGLCSQPSREPAQLTSAPTPVVTHHKRAPAAHTGGTTEASGLVAGEIVLLGPSGHVLHEAIPLRSGDVAELPHTSKKHKS